VFNGLGKQTADRLNAVKYTPLNGTEMAIFGAEAYAAGQKAHSTASVPGLDEGDWYIPGIDEEYEIFSAMNTDGSDPVNAAFVAAGSTARDLSVVRCLPCRSDYYGEWLLNAGGYFRSAASSAQFANSNTLCVVAQYDVGE
jgi:hypothetical protein